MWWDKDQQEGDNNSQFFKILVVVSRIEQVGFEVESTKENIYIYIFILHPYTSIHILYPNWIQTHKILELNIQIPQVFRHQTLGSFGWHKCQ